MRRRIVGVGVCRLRRVAVGLVVLALAACGRAAAPVSDAEAAVAVVSADRAALGLPADVIYSYLGAAGDLAFVEAAGAGRYMVVRLTRTGELWRVAGAGPVWDQPVATGEIQSLTGLAPGDWQKDPRTAAQREGMALGLSLGSSWGQSVSDGSGTTILATVSPAQGSYLLRLQQAGGAWRIVDIEPRGGVARRSSSFDIATPGLGATVGSPLHVTGRARVFEAAFFVELQDGSGRVLVHQDAMAQTDESGWGTFDLSLAHAGGAAGPGRLIFGYISPKDGSRVEDVVVPVTLGD
jgi:hypothetical protein